MYFMLSVLRMSAQCESVRKGSGTMSFVPKTVIITFSGERKSRDDPGQTDATTKIVVASLVVIGSVVVGVLVVMLLRKRRSNGRYTNTSLSGYWYVLK